VSLIIHDGMIYAANCGSSSIYCSTIGGKIIRLAVPHTTSNETEVDRIVRAGGRLYQTIVNVPFKKVMNVKGPLRIFPTGLTVTRTIGRSVERSRQKTQYSSNKQVAGITNTPEIQYLPES
jgi:serine/threonine protein phosphatase PrpC